jgi:ABC-type protease/lipase transport system fused ATPase/permease subunit
MARMKQTLRYHNKENLRRIEELRERITKEPTVPLPDTPASIDATVLTAVPPTAVISTLVSTIATSGPTSITTIVDNTGTTTSTIISTVVPGLNIESRKGTPTTVASAQPVINIDSDSDKEELLPEHKHLKTDKY